MDKDDIIQILEDDETNKYICILQAIESEDKEHIMKLINDYWEARKWRKNKISI